MKLIRLKTVCLIVVLICFFIELQAQSGTVKVTDWGIEPGSGINVVPILKKIMTQYRGYAALNLEFPPGRFDFWPDDPSSETTGFNVTSMRNLVVNGNGASFIFHGKMRPFLISHSTNVTLKNFSIDWDRPFISQGEIVQVTGNFLDLKIDPVQYPYRIEKDSLTFFGENWTSKMTSSFINLHNLFDKEKKEVVYRTRDNPLGNIFLGKAEEIKKGIIRFHGPVAFKPELGTYVTLFHGRYLTPGIEIYYCLNTKLENVTIYHALSHGILGEKSKNISVRNSSVTINEKKGRVFSTIADASHFANCSGKIIMDNCAHTGMGDDFINCQGIYVKVLGRINDHLLEIAAQGRYGLKLTDSGDELFFVDSTTMKRQGRTGIIRKIDTIWVNHHLKSYLITMTSSVPAGVGSGFFLENKTWSPSVEIRNCRILKKHRARGILVTTPKPVIIENNYFNTAGSAILIEGDLNYWFESGGNKAVLIRNNTFEDCLTSGPEWGEAVITITPSILPKDEFTLPYHRNIRIENNLFKHYDRSLLYARSVDGLLFRNNKVIRTKTYVPFSENPTFYFDGCRNVRVQNNQIPQDFPGRNITIVHMLKSALETDL